MLPWVGRGTLTESGKPAADAGRRACGTVYPHGHRKLPHPKQGHNVVGMKSYGRTPNFLAMTEYEQVRSITAALASDRGQPTAPNSPSPRPESAASPDSSTISPQEMPTAVAAALRRRTRLSCG